MTSSSPPPDFGPELRQLAQALLDRLDPAVRAAASAAGEALRGPGRCQQVWCPVCAVAALISGEQHPLLTLAAEHSVTLVTVLRAMATDPGAPGTGPADDKVSAVADDTPPGSQDGRYHDIPIVVEPIGDTPVGSIGEP